MPSMGEQLCRTALDAKFYALHAMICCEQARPVDGYLVLQVGAGVCCSWHPSML